MFSQKVNCKLTFSMFSINANIASYTCCFGLSTLYHKLYKKKRCQILHWSTTFAFWWMYSKIQQLVNCPENTRIMLEVKRKNEQNGRVSFPPSGQLNVVEVVVGTGVRSAFHSSGFHAYLCFLKINAPEKRYIVRNKNFKKCTKYRIAQIRSFHLD